MLVMSVYFCNSYHYRVGQPASKWLDLIDIGSVGGALTGLCDHNDRCLAKDELGSVVSDSESLYETKRLAEPVNNINPV